MTCMKRTIFRVLQAVRRAARCTFGQSVHAISRQALDRCVGPRSEALEATAIGVHRKENLRRCEHQQAHAVEPGRSGRPGTLEGNSTPAGT